MITKLVLSQEVAHQIAAAAQEEATSHHWMVAIAIVDEGGQLLFFTRMDHSTNAAGGIAVAKAKHAANYRRDTKFHEDLLKSGHLGVLALPDALPVEGGVQLLFKEKVIGAIGISGAASADDGQIASRGARFLLSLEDG